MRQMQYKQCTVPKVIIVARVLEIRKLTGSCI